MNDDQLRRLLNDAVSDVEPEDRLEELRASVRPGARVVQHLHTRPWYAAAAIVAAVICLVAYITNVASNKSSGPGFATSGGSSAPTIIATDTAEPSTSPSTTDPTDTTGTTTYAVYYAGENPDGQPVLFREFHRAADSRPTMALALDALQAAPLDPDYSTAWQAGWLKDAKANPNAGVIFVTPSSALPADRPAGMTSDQARVAVQQVVYTLQAASQTRLPVQFIRHGIPVDHVLGVSTATPLAKENPLSVLSLMNISDPNEGDEVTGRLTVTGVNNTFEGNVVVYLERGGQRFSQRSTIGGWGPGRLFPWRTTIDLSALAPGRYTLVATDGGNAEGTGHAWVDTRVIEVR
jgi:hypothetical protein